MLTSKWTKVGVFLLSLGPVEWLIWKGFQGELTANPIEFLTHELGDWTLIFVILTLSVTPARRLLHLPALIRYRRMLGLFAFFYACCHFSIFFIFDHFFDVSAMIEDVVKRKYITVGMLGFALLIPLAVTSTAGWIRRLGGKRWHKLHQAIYIIGIAGVVHFFWLVKSDITRPTRYAIAVGLLLVYRLAVWLAQERTQPLRPAGKLSPTDGS
jgi:methionine sulfoxide reductase heme-binding subunit